MGWLGLGVIDNATCWNGVPSNIMPHGPSHDESVVVDREVHPGLQPMTPMVMKARNQRPAC